MELKLIKSELKYLENEWYKLTIETNLKTIELYLKPRIEIKADNPITLASRIGDTLSTIGDINNYVVESDE